MGLINVMVKKFINKNNLETIVFDGPVFGTKFEMNSRYIRPFYWFSLDYN